MVLALQEQSRLWFRPNISHVACHPGFHQTLALSCQCFWWPTMTADTRENVAACSVCAHGKTSHHPPSGLLCPLPIPHHPWTQIAVDFVTGLPPSEGSTVILTIVDRFSKLVNFVPLPKLPRPLKLLTSSLYMYSGYMAYPLTLSQIGDSSLPLKS